MVDVVFLAWAVIGLVLHLAAALLVGRGARTIVRLWEIPPADDDLPWISIVIPARNEERDIQAALQSVLQLDYPHYEVIAVDDRSTDRTGEILDEFARRAPRLRVVHVRELPAGWLGKNHALQCGAQQARGEYLLFTDADVVFEPTTLRRALTLCRRQQLDHLAAMPRIQMPNWLLESFAVTFAFFFSAYFQPWKARDPRSRAHIGIGAFNMLRTAAYRSFGGHQPIAMRPDDDLKLGHVVKLHGLRQDAADASRLLMVPWYASVAETIRGLEKNAFSGVDYRLWIIVVSSFSAVAFNVAPFVLVFLAPGVWARWIFGASVMTLLGTCGLAARSIGVRPGAALGFPLAVLLFVYIQWRTTILTLWQGGIRWRDTFYPLAELKANRVG